MMKKKYPLHTKIIIGLILGVIYAFISSYFNWNTFTIRWIDPFGTIFIRLLKLIAVPLVLFSIISGIMSLSDISRLGKIGLKTVSFYIFTTIIAVSIGLLFANFFKPGKSINDENRIKNRLSYEIWATEKGVDIQDNKRFLQDSNYASYLMNIPASQRNISNLNLEKYEENAQKTRDASPLQMLVDIVPENVFNSVSSNQLMLQVIFFAIFFGICSVFLPNKTTDPVMNLVNSINEVFLKMTEIIMNAAPFFVFALLAGVIAKMAKTPSEVIQIFKGLGTYCLVVVGALAFVLFCFYPIVTSLYVKKLSYKDFFRKISSAQLMAFSTSSSAATLPVTMRCLKKNIGVSNNVASFVLPIGATVNMDGSSLLQAVACIFLAQFHMIDLSFSQQMIIVITATLASIGTAAIPGAALIMLIIVLQSVGLNPAWIAIIFPVDRILDMCRTVINVTGDAMVCTIIAQSEGEIKNS